MNWILLTVQECKAVEALIEAGMHGPAAKQLGIHITTFRCHLNAARLKLGFVSSLKLCVEYEREKRRGNA